MAEEGHVLAGGRYPVVHFLSIKTYVHDFPSTQYAINKDVS